MRTGRAVIFSSVYWRWNIKHCVGKTFLFEKTVWVGVSRDRLLSCPDYASNYEHALLSCRRISYYRGNSWGDHRAYICLITNSMYVFQQQLTELFWDHQVHNDWFDVFIAGRILLAFIKISGSILVWRELFVYITVCGLGLLMSPPLTGQGTWNHPSFWRLIQKITFTHLPSLKKIICVYKQYLT